MTTLKSCHLLLLLSLLLLAFVPSSANDTHGHQRVLNSTNSTNNTQNFITVHLVAHTHNDAGWIATADSYFNGNWRGCVKCIIDAVVAGLQKNPARKFVYVEQYFFQKWWNLQNEEKKNIVRNLVKNGQLEFLNGGWVMNDEGCTYYDDIIEQMTLGHRYIKSQFNQTVNAGWHIDPFGHSAPQARLFSEMGFDSWFFERIDSDDFENRKKTGDLEFIWRPEGYNKNKNFLLAHANFMKYYLAPFGYCITVFCAGGDHGTAQRYADWIKGQVAYYPKTKHILHQIGGDFEWRSADYQFQQLERLITFFDNNPQYGIKAQFSTPSLYAEAVYKETLAHNITLAEKTDDFFPYRDAPNAFWTGYFTSKPHLKKAIRDGSRYLQSVKKLLSKLYFKGNLTFADIGNATTDFEAALATLQHHDAATGTAKKFVDDDYFKIMEQGYNSINAKLLPMLGNLFKEKHPQSQPRPFLLMTSNFSAIRLEQERQSQHVIASVYNPSQIQTRVIRFPVPNSAGTLKADSTYINYDLICGNDRDSRTCEVCFLDQIGTNQLKTYVWYHSGSTDDTYASRIQTLSLSDDVDYRIHLFNNESLYIKNGSPSHFEYVTADGKVHPFTLDYYYYRSYQSKDGGYKPQRSGAYIFRAAGQNATRYAVVPTTVQIKRGSHFIEVTIKRESAVTTRLRFYNTTGIGGATPGVDIHVSSPMSQTIEIESLLGPINVSDQIGKEIVLRIERTGINNRGVFYTNSNGLENQKRIRNSKVTVNDSVAGNYYPVNSAIYIEDARTGDRVTLMNDRSQGGSSLEDGALEVMINRRCLEDDDRGVDEPLNDERPVEVKHWLTFSKGSLKQRLLQYDFDTAPLVYLSTAAQVNAPQTSPSTQFPKVLKVDLVKFYIRVYNETEMIVRLHNLREDQAVIVRGFLNKEAGSCQVLQEELLERLKPLIKIKDVKEVTLTTTQEKREMLKNKYRWNGIGDESLNAPEQGSSQYESVLLAPLEEKVFLLTYSLT